MNFSELGLSPKVLEAISAAGYTTPTTIQAEAIPHALQRKDVLAPQDGADFSPAGKRPGPGPHATHPHSGTHPRTGGAGP